MYGTALRHTVLRMGLWEQTDTTYTYSGMGTLVPRGPYEGTEQASVDVREGRWQFYSCRFRRGR